MDVSYTSYGGKRKQTKSFTYCTHVVGQKEVTRNSPLTSERETAVAEVDSPQQQAPPSVTLNCRKQKKADSE